MIFLINVGKNINYRHMVNVGYFLSLTRQGRDKQRGRERRRGKEEEERDGTITMASSETNNAWYLNV